MVSHYISGGFYGFSSKSKIWHLLFWTLLILSNVFIYFDENVPLLVTTFENSSVFIVAMISFYFTSSYLVPNYLYNNKLSSFFLFTLGLTLVMAILYYMIFHIYVYLYSSRLNVTLDSMGFDLSPVREFLIIFWTYLIPPALATTLKIFLDNFKTKSKLMAIRLENRTAELAFLRNQMHPHFLFNVLNNIYFRISKENKKARNLVECTCDILRYQLYSDEYGLVEMEKEVNYLKQFIRISEYMNTIDVKIKLKIDEHIFRFKIMASLLIPVLEIVIKTIKSNAITLNVTLLEEGGNSIVYLIKTGEKLTGSNPKIFENMITNDLTNIKRRLEILFPKNHAIEAKDDNGFFLIKITLSYGLSQMPNY